MAQRPKEHVRARMVGAAASLFAEVGFEATTVALVAERAGSSIGNVYKYFESKEAIFAAAVPEEFARELKRMTRGRVKALGRALDVGSLPRNARYHVLSEELLEYCIENREKVVVLLARAKGTPFEGFAEGFADDLVDWALEYVRGAYPGVVVTRALRFSLREIYRNYLAAVAHALTAHREPSDIREVTRHLTAHHQGGLKRLFEDARDAELEAGEKRRKSG